MTKQYRYCHLSLQFNRFDLWLQSFTSTGGPGGPPSIHSTGGSRSIEMDRLPACRWHVFEAIEAHVHTVNHIPEDEKWLSFKQGFREVVDTVSLEELNATWSKFRQAWVNTNPQAIQYLEDTWLCDGRKQSLCRAFFAHVAHFSIITSSP